MQDSSGLHNPGAVPLDKITIVFLSDFNALILALKAGSIDGAGLTGALIQQLNHDYFDIVPFNSASVQLMALNNAAAPLNDLRVRQAINYSIDIKEIIDTAFYGMGEPSGSPIIPGMELYYEEITRDPYPLDIEKASKLLSHAGYGNEKGQKKLSLEIKVPSVYSMHVDTAQVIASQLEKAGIQASIRQIDWASWLSDVYRERKYEATIISLDAVNTSPRGFLSRYYSDSGTNFMNFNKAAFDVIYNESLTETDDEKRISLYKKAQRLISDEAASVFIQDIRGFMVFRKDAYSGFLSYPMYVIDFYSMNYTGK
jgi:peptide/nickel transport system substrate-binding protein